MNNRLMIDEKIDADGLPDIYLADDGDIAFATDAVAVALHVKQRLTTFNGEWFLDTSVGVKWLSEVMGFGPDTAISESLMKSEMMKTDGVVEITGFSYRFDPATREMRGSGATVLTDYDVEVRL